MNVNSSIIDSMITFHNWRQKYNKSDIGYGIDQYAQDRCLHYPEAYAKFARGYLHLYNATKDDTYLELGKSALKWLKLHQSKRFKKYCWGLPFGWNGVPEDGAYLLTTAFCGQVFLDYYTVLKEDEYLEIAENAATWIIDELLVNCNGYKTLFYSPYDPLRYCIPNATSIALGFLSQLSKHSMQDFDTDNHAIAQHLFNLQDPNGYWAYSEKASTVDNVHTAYVLEGLWQYVDAYGMDRFVPSLTYGTETYWSTFFTDHGYGKEFLLYSLSDIHRQSIFRILKDTIIYHTNNAGFLAKRTLETPLWGYAAAIRALVYAGCVEERYIHRATIIFQNLKNTHQDPTGYFYFRSNEKIPFIRHLSHIFESLGLLLEKC